jgi:NADPH2:quinone reductase
VDVIDTPEPGRGEVRVRLHATGVNPYDVKLRAGVNAPTMPFPRIVPHHDGAGVIEAIGPDVVGRTVGERVWIWNGQVRRAFGTAAQHIVVPSAQAARLPDALSFDQGASLGVPYLTAYQALLCDGAVDGQAILVSGGGGVVGNLAIRLARAQGAALVIATASSAASADHAREAGAHLVLDYRRVDLADAVRAATGGHGVDRLIEVEFGANLPLFTRILRPGGTVFSYGSASNMMPVFDFKAINGHGLTLHFQSVFGMAPGLRADAIADLAALVRDHGLAPSIGARFTLAEIAAAHEAVEAGQTIGKIVVSIP